MDSISGIKSSDNKLSGLSGQSQSQSASGPQGVDSTQQGGNSQQTGAAKVANSTFGSKDI